MQSKSNRRRDETKMAEREKKKKASSRKPNRNPTKRHNNDNNRRTYIVSVAIQIRVDESSCPPVRREIDFLFVSIALTDAGIVVNERVDALAFLLIGARAEAAEERSHPQSPPSVVASFPATHKHRKVYSFHVYVQCTTRQVKS